jgi:hypothetical protein
VLDVFIGWSCLLPNFKPLCYYELGILLFFMFDVVTITGSSTEAIPCSIHTDVNFNSARQHHVCNHRLLQGEIRALGVDSSSGI